MVEEKKMFEAHTYKHIWYTHSDTHTLTHPHTSPGSPSLILKGFFEYNPVKGNKEATKNPSQLQVVEDKQIGCFLPL